MQKRSLYRILSMLVSLVLTSMMIFVLIRMAPGDPISRLVYQPGERALSKEAKEERIAKIKEEKGLNKSAPEQYIHWISKVSRFDLGEAILTGESVNKAIKSRLPASLGLGVVCSLVQVLFGLYLAVLSVKKYGCIMDKSIQLFLVVMVSLPYFVFALAVLHVLSVEFSVFPMINKASISRLWLPGLIAGLSTVPDLARFVRILLLDELGKPYIIDGIAKGFSKDLLLKRALRNLRIPIFQRVVLSFVVCLGGLVMTEDLFMWPGLGQYGVNAVAAQDYTQLQGYLIVVAFLVLLANGISDWIIYNQSTAHREAASNEK